MFYVAVLILFSSKTFQFLDHIRFLDHIKNKFLDYIKFTNIALNTFKLIVQASRLKNKITKLYGNRMSESKNKFREKLRCHSQ